MKKQNDEIYNAYGGYLPILIDVETGGLDPKTDALLEVSLKCPYDNLGIETMHVLPPQFSGINKSALKINKLTITFINEEFDTQLYKDCVDKRNHDLKSYEHTCVLIDQYLLSMLKKFKVKQNKCILAGQNGNFDLGFIKEMYKRASMEMTLLHPYRVIDTNSLIMYLSDEPNLESYIRNKTTFKYNKDLAHSSRYDVVLLEEVWNSLNNSVALVQKVNK